MPAPNRPSETSAHELDVNHAGIPDSLPHAGRRGPLPCEHHAAGSAGMQGRERKVADLRVPFVEVLGNDPRFRHNRDMTGDVEETACSPGWLRPLLSGAGFLLGVLYMFGSIWFPMFNSSLPVRALELYVLPSPHLVAMLASFTIAFRRSTKGRAPWHGRLWLFVVAALIGLGLGMLLILAAYTVVGNAATVVGNWVAYAIWLGLTAIAGWVGGNWIGRQATTNEPDVPRCPACRYILYHASDSRCPDCGRSFGRGEVDLRKAIISEEGVLLPREMKNS
jgi:hypothetical protein